jgi:hypothetical protein
MSVFLAIYFETNGHFDSNVKLFSVLRKLSGQIRNTLMNKNFRFAQLMQRLLPISLLLIST